MNDLIVKDREMLEKRLKELSETEYKGELFCGAMCYSIAAPTKEYDTCPVCGEKTVQTNYMVWNIKSIRKIVAEIKQLGYDVILDEHEFCVKCGGDIQAPDAQLIFKIRLSPNEAYHTAQSNIISDYNCVLEFLKGNDFCRGEQYETLPIHDNIDVIQKMLGLGKDIPFVKRKWSKEDYLFQRQ
jgi:hypothetical protein